MGETDEAVELNPPSPLRVARRALVMCAVVCRAFIENESDTQWAEDLRHDVIEWTKCIGVFNELEPKEIIILTTPIGQLLAQDHINYSWQCEGLAVLAWALQRFDLPEYDQQIVAADVTDTLGFLDNEEAQKMLRTTVLRNTTELNQYAELMFSLHWRLRDYSLTPRPMDFQKVAKEAWFGPLEIRGLRFADQDLVIGEQSISKVAEQKRKECLGITTERHRAINWLLGNDETYSQVTTDT